MKKYRILVAVLLSITHGSFADKVYGLDRLGQFDQLPVLLEGTQALQVSSHDRRGGNMGDGYYATHPCLYTDTNGEKVLYDEQNPGCLYRFWMTFTDSSVLTNELKFYFDGEPAPRLQISVGEFFVGTNAPFLFPLVGNAAHSCKGYYSYYPFPYEQGLKVTISSVPTGTGYSASPFYYNMTFHRFDSDDDVYTWDGSEDSSTVMAQIEHVGSDPKDAGFNSSVTGSVSVAAGSEENLLSMSGDAVIQSIRLFPSSPSFEELQNTFLVMNWDGGAAEVDVPVGCFFGSGTNELDVRSLPIGMSATNGYYCYFPMPFWESASISISNAGASSVTIPYEIQYATNSLDRQRCGYFCVEHRSQYVVSDGNDVIFADTSGRGHLVGLSLFIRGDDFTGNNLDHLEGDERIHVDGSASPAIYGTGTEDYFNCAWYFANAPALLPYHGVALQEFFPEPPNCTQTYRFHIGDVVPFYSSLSFGMEHGRANNTSGLYDSVAYLYMQPSSGLEQVADFNVMHGGGYSYSATGAVDSVTNSWCFEGDDDQTYYSSTGFSFTGASEFIVPAGTNAGIILRRMTDRGIGGQKASVYVDGAFAGIWYDADCNFVTQRLYNTTTYLPVDQRWLESDFYVPPMLSAGKSNLLIQVVRDADGADSWNEYHYTVFRVLPLASPSDIDEDGLPDKWETTYFSHIGEANPTLDNDADHYSNEDEFIAHTSPVDPASFFRVEVMPGHDFAFYAYSDRIYDVLTKTNLTDAGWGIAETGPGDDTYHYLPWNGSSVFYKVGVRKPD